MWFPDDISEVHIQNFTKFTEMVHYGLRTTPIDFDLHSSKGFSDDISKASSQNFTKFMGIMHYGSGKTPIDFDFHRSEVKVTAAIFVLILHPKWGFWMISPKFLNKILPNSQE